jgi:AAA15 family ATPase/GTPase
MDAYNKLDFSTKYVKILILLHTLLLIMLLEFSVTNFCSIKEKQTLSLLKTTKNKLKNNFTTITLSTGKTLDVLNSAVIYGANASGKSNLVLALGAMLVIIEDSFSYQPNKGVKNIEPFLLSKKSANQPTEFELDLINDGIRYVYGFSATQEKIIDEWLYQYPKGSPQNLIDRQSTNQWGTMTALKGKKKAWQESTKDNSLFLSTATQLNSESLSIIFSAIDKVKHVSGELLGGFGYTCHQANKSKENTQEILDFMKAADVDIENFSVLEEKVDEEKIPDEVKKILKKDGEDLSKLRSVKVETQHVSDDGSVVSFDFEDQESDGTQKLFRLAGPWLNVLKNGYCLVMDELHNSLHPKLVAYLVSMFHNPEINKCGAQLIFVTHETSLLNQDTFRQDQVWFCEKENNATEIFSLADFKVRKGVDNLESAYLSGRYGAVPYLK